MKAEVAVIKLGEDWFEIKKVEPPKQEVADSSVPTLMEVFNKVKPEWILNMSNCVYKDSFAASRVMCHSQLSTKTQCKRIQALIAMQAIADYYNGEVDYRGEGYSVCFIKGDARPTAQHSEIFSVPKFKQSEHAELAIEILRAAGLLDNLK